MNREPRDMTPEELVELALQLHARCGGWDVSRELREQAAELRAEVLRRVKLAPKPATQIQDTLLTRKECCFLLNICRETLWKMQRRGLVFIRGEVRLSALADFLGADIARRRDKGNCGTERAQSE